MQRGEVSNADLRRETAAAARPRLRKTTSVMRVSVVTPAFNAEEFIEEAVRSVHAQTHRPMEHIVVNDGSVDATGRIVARLADELSSGDYHLRLVEQSSNKGAAAALVDGVGLASGDAICWLSADDAFVEATKTQKQLAVMGEAEVVFDTQFYTGGKVDEARLVRARWPLAMQLSAGLRSYRPDSTLVGLLLANPINGSSILMRRHIFDEVAGFDLALGNIDADADLWMRLSALRVRMVPRAAPGIFYRLHAGQTSNKTAEMAAGTTLSRMRIIQALDDRDRLVPLLQENKAVLQLGLVSRQHRAWPYVTAELARIVGQRGVAARWAHLAMADLRHRQMLVQGTSEEMGKRARELQTSKEFRRFLGQLG